MTTGLRAAHGRIWLVLAILLPVLFLLALAARQDSTPVNRNLNWERLR